MLYRIGAKSTCDRRSASSALVVVLSTMPRRWSSYTNPR
jgi:hypothetical protein